MRLAGYIRVSTEGQVDAYGKDVQREAILRWSALRGHQVVAWYEEDGVSGTTGSAERPALSAALAASDEFEGIVALDATRIARRSIQQDVLLHFIWESGLRVFTTTAEELCADEDDPSKIAFRQMLAVFSEFDHRSIVKRLQSARKIKSAQGGYIGGVTRYGRSVVGSGKTATFTSNEAERRAIQLIKRWHREGFTLREIAARLSEEQVPTKTGKSVWHHQTIARILDRLE